MKFIRILIWIETALLMLSLSIMMILAFAQVVLRNIFGTGFLWADPLVRQMVLWTGFLGATLATNDDRHISIDAFTKYFSVRTKRMFKIVTSAAAAVVTFFLLSAAWEFMVNEKEAGGEIFLGIPSWVGLAIIPLGYALITIHFAVNVIINAKARFGRGADEGRAS
jgi:TRAP-type C4-dicarboxylate transport system permease small subunit